MEHVLHLCNENSYLIYLPQLNRDLALFLQKAYCSSNSQKTPKWPGFPLIYSGETQEKKKMHCRQNLTRGAPQGGKRSIRLKTNLFWCSLRNLFLQPVHQQNRSRCYLMYSLEHQLHLPHSHSYSK